MTAVMVVLHCGISLYMQYTAVVMAAFVMVLPHVIYLYMWCTAVVMAAMIMVLLWDFFVYGIYSSCHGSNCLGILLIWFICICNIIHSSWCYSNRAGILSCCTKSWLISHWNVLHCQIYKPVHEFHETVVRCMHFEIISPSMAEVWNLLEEHKPL